MAKKIDVEKFKEWIQERIIDEDKDIDKWIAKEQYEEAYGCKQAIGVYDFILERIESEEEEWLDESES